MNNFLYHDQTFRVLLDEGAYPYYITTIEGKLLSYNQSFIEFLNPSPNTPIKNSNLKELLPTPSPQWYEEALKQDKILLRAETTPSIDFSILLEGRTVKFHKALIENSPNEKVIATLVMTSKASLQPKEEKLQNEITQLKEALENEIVLRKSKEQELKLSSKVFHNAIEGILITNLKGNIISVNPAFSRITGYSKSEVIGKNPRILKSGRHDKHFYTKLWETVLSKGQWEGEIWNRRKSGEPYPEWLTISSIKGVGGKITHYVAVFHDIANMKRQEEQIRYQAFHDALTQLPNRALLIDRMQVAISKAGRNKSKMAIMFLDLDNFKHINDSLGHAVGDLLLQKVAKRLRSLMRKSDTVSRLGGDEFVIMATYIHDEKISAFLAKRILSAFKSPFQVNHRDLFVNFSIGITLFPEDGDTPDTLIKNADMAMYKAKDRGKHQYHLFTSSMNHRVQRRLKLEENLRRAMLKKEIIVYYQPKININTGTISGMEALVRWGNPELGLVSPNEFIPLAEETGLIIPLGKDVLNEACSQTKLWLEQLKRDLRISVNLSPKQFQQPDLEEMILQVIELTGLPPKHLELEITETTLMVDIPKAIQKLERLSQLGISISIDDFGTGYSSLYYLKHFPINILKIDRSFVRDITIDPNDATIVTTIIGMAKSLNIEVIAEGVETHEQLNFLKNEGCDEIQGYLFSPPVPKENFLQLMEKPLGEGFPKPISGVLKPKSTPKIIL